MFCDKAISAAVAGHFAGLTLAHLPGSTVHATRRALLDAIGVMIGATGLSETSRPYLDLAMVTPGPARLLSSGTRTTPSLAALANGALAHALDFGDTFDAGPAHPNAALVPALLALADAEPKIMLGDLLTAMAAGSDLACRLSLAPARPYEDGGWYPPPLVNLIASAAAAAKLLGLDADGIRDAMGLALMQGAFPSEIKYDTTSPMRGVREGFAARAAVDAALLACAGATAFAKPLEGRAAFFAVYGGGPPRDGWLDGLGTRFLGDQVSFKPWPSCRGTHPYIEAALAMRDETPLSAIERIEAETGPIQEMLIRPQPAKAAPGSATEAKFSIPFTVAAALIDGNVTLSTFLPDRIADAATQNLAAKIHEVRNPGWGRAQAASGGLTIIFRDGRRIERRIMQSAGHPDRPLSDSHLIAKFEDCVRWSVHPLSADAAQTLARRILDADPALSASRLMD